MFAKNTGPKVIGFGSLILAPGESNELPEGFDQRHPTIRFYIEKGWLTPPFSGSEQEAAAPQSTPGETTEEEERVERERLAAEEQARKVAEAQKAEEFAAKLKALAVMKLVQLQEEAKSLGIEFEESDTKQVLAQKIIDKYQAE
jgi:hypothetical protein